MLDRIKLLEGFIEEDPGDPFNYYALGLEYAKKDEQKRALEIFKRLVSDHKDYVPTYYQLAKLYEQLGQKESALSTYHDGILVAKRQLDFKTQQELMAGLAQLNED
jgi:tetratricopeptide (TPR) repeat protein